MSQQLDLDRLRSRFGERPRTKTGQLRQVWPLIKGLLADGHTLKDIRNWLKDIGLEMGYARLSQCVNQLRLRDQAAQAPLLDLRRGPMPTVAEQLQDQSPGQAQASNAVSSDPLRNLREQRVRKNSFSYDPFPTKGLTE